MPVLWLCPASPLPAPLRGFTPPSANYRVGFFLPELFISMTKFELFWLLWILTGFLWSKTPPDTQRQERFLPARTGRAAVGRDVQKEVPESVS